MQRVIRFLDINKAGTRTLLGWAMLLLMFDRFWGYIFTNTVFASTAMIYALFITVLILFVGVFAKNNLGKQTTMSIIWLPYLLYTLIGYLLSFKLQQVTYWYACFVMLIVASKTTYIKDVPYRFLFWSGLFCMLGVLIQLFFPSFYNSRISKLLVVDYIDTWVEGYGYNGFTCQLGKTANILIYGEVVLLYMKDQLLNRFFKRKWIYYMLVLMFIGCVFLTGKRLLAALALVLPFIVYFLTERRGIIKYTVLIIIAVFTIFGYLYFSSNTEEFTDNIFLRRFAYSYLDASSGGDITSGRTYLYMQALDAYKEHPMFGVGVGRFKAYTGATTDVHNTYLQVLCEQGIVGFVIFIIPLIICFVRTCNFFSKTRGTPYFKYLEMALAMQLVYIIYCLTGNENLGAGVILYFMGIAIAISVESQYKFARS